MTLYIIVAALLVAAIVAFVLLKKKKGFAKQSSKTKAVAQQDTTSTAENIEQAPVKTSLDDNLRREIENNIRHKNYSVAEAQINTALHQDSSQHDLYLLLADVHLNQDDELALEKLITHLQQNRLYDIVDQIIVKKETFTVQKESQPVITTESVVAASTAAAAAATVASTVDFDSLSAPSESQMAVTDTSADNSLDFSFSNTAEQAPTTDNSLNFDALLNTSASNQVDTSFDSLATAQPSESQDLAISFSKPKTAEEIASDLDFSFSESKTEEVATDVTFSFDEPKVEETATDLNFSFDEPKVEETATDLNFSFDEPKVEEVTTDLNFSFDESKAEEATTDVSFSFDEPKVEEAATDVSFSFDEPKVEETATDVSFSFDEPKVEETATDLAFNENVADDILSPAESAIAGAALASAVSTNTTDPLVAQFSHLAQYDEVAVNLKLAQQYVNLGAYDAARNLLVNRDLFEATQNETADAILERIAS